MKKTLDSNAIKLVAIAAMTVDHVAWWLFPGYPRAVLPLAMHIIGRLTCPIMCYFVAEGYHHTRDIRKYTARMFLFAVISHFAYVFASADFAGWRSFIPFSSGSVLNQTSVMWSLAWGLVMLRVVHDRRLRPAVQVALILLICLVSFPELYRRPVHHGLRYQSGKAEDAGAVDDVLCGALRGGVRPGAGLGLRPGAAGGGAGRSRAGAV